jgi:hypothetical protein
VGRFRPLHRRGRRRLRRGGRGGAAAGARRLDARRPSPDLAAGPPLVVPALGLPPEAALDGTVVYRDDPEALAHELAAGQLGTGFFLPPMPPAEFAAAIAQGELLPPKSTRFLPKVMAGLVWTDHSSALA